MIMTRGKPAPQNDINVKLDMQIKRANEVSFWKLGKLCVQDPAQFKENIQL